MRQFLLLTLLISPCQAVEPELRQFAAWPFEAALTVYQRWVSPYKPSRCSMLPSDSAYARQALNRFGIWRGSLMAVDRLHRCGHDARYYRLVMTEDGPRLSDPLIPALEVP